MVLSLLWEFGNVLRDEPWVSSGAVLGLGDAHPPAPNMSVHRNFLVVGRLLVCLVAMQSEGFG